MNGGSAQEHIECGSVIIKSCVVLEGFSIQKAFASEAPPQAPMREVGSDTGLLFLKFLARNTFCVRFVLCAGICQF